MAITGPESTGKSELARSLAERYDSLWVPEYSREYLAGLDRKYYYGDILEIAKGQFVREQEATAKANKIIFIDTEFIVNKIWCEDKFGKCHAWINEMISEHVYDLYLLCNTDIPWSPDPLRENPGDRDRLFDLYMDELKTRGLPFHVIKGTGPERKEMAARIVSAEFEKYQKPKP